MQYFYLPMNTFLFLVLPSVITSIQMKSSLLILLAAASVRLYGQPCIPNTNSIQFDGFSSYIAISPQTGLDITTTVTIEAWIKPSAFGFNSAQNSIVCKHGWSSGEGGFVLRCGGSGELSFNIGGVDTNNVNVSWVEVFSSLNALSLNTWYHVAGTYDGYELKCYVNGNLEGTTSFQGSIAPSTAYPLAIGRLADPVWGPDRYFSGSMDEVRVWNRALSQSEIMAGMNNHIDPSSASGLVSYWRMNEGLNSTVYDVAGTNNGGTVFCTWDTDVPFNAVPESPILTYNGGTLYSSAPIGNQWYLDGTAIGGATQDSYTPLQNGIYTVEVTSPEGCTALSAPFTITDVSTGDVDGVNSVSIYPNPFHDRATLNIIFAGKPAAASFSLTDYQGRKVKELSFSGALISSGISISRDQLSNGIYFYELLTDNGSISHGKLIID